MCSWCLSHDRKVEAFNINVEAYHFQPIKKKLIESTKGRVQETERIHIRGPYTWFIYIYIYIGSCWHVHLITIYKEKIRLCWETDKLMNVQKVILTTYTLLWRATGWVVSKWFINFMLDFVYNVSKFFKT